MSLARRLWLALRGRTDSRPSYYAPTYDLERELPYLHEQIQAYASRAPIRMGGRAQLDNFSGETIEMRNGYLGALLKEPSIKAALLGKIASVQALGLNVKPYDKTPLDQCVADWVKHSLTSGKGGLPALIDRILTPGLAVGFSVSEKVWQRETRGRWAGKIGLQRLSSKDTRYIQYEIDAFRNVTGVVSMRGNSGQVFPPSDFVLFDHLSLFESPFGTSDLRAAYRAAEMIPSLLRTRMIFLDKYAGPFIHGKVADPAMVENMKADLAQARQGGLIVTTPADDISVIDLATKGTGEFLDALKDLREEIAIGISGAFLTMMTSTGGQGARGNAEVQQDTVDLFIWILKEKVQACINEQLVPDLVDVNFGTQVGLPVVSLEAPNPEHIAAELGIDQLMIEMGFPTSGEDAYERAGRRPPKDPNDGPKPAGGGVPGGGGQPGQPAIPGTSTALAIPGQPAPGGGPAAGNFPAGDWFAG